MPDDFKECLQTISTTKNRPLSVQGAGSLWSKWVLAYTFYKMLAGPQGGQNVSD